MNNCYVYILNFEQICKFYIGARYSKYAVYGDIGISYFTSSTYVKKIWLEDEIQPNITIYPCESKEHAMLLEEQLQLQLQYGAPKNPKCLNKYVGGKFMPIVDYTDDMRAKRSAQLKAQWAALTPEEKARRIKVFHNNRNYLTLQCNTPAARAKALATKRKKRESGILTNSGSHGFVTPAGVFSGVKEAKEHYGWALDRLRRQFPDQYYKVSNPTQFKKTE